MSSVEDRLMIVSPNVIPNNMNDNGIVTQKILEVQQQLVMLNRHEREHITGDIDTGNATCPYCQHCDSDNFQIGNNQKENKKKISTRNEIEREVEISDKNGRVIVPKTWAGKLVRITLVEDQESY
jgi:hypothetical protein